MDMDNSVMIVWVGAAGEKGGGGRENKGYKW